MYSQIICLITIVLTTAGGLCADTTTYQGEGNIRYDVDVTLHDFYGTAIPEPFTATISGADGNQRFDMIIRVTIDKMDSRNTKRDKDMREMFNAPKHPVITGTFSGIDWDEVVKGSANGPVELPFTLTISGREQPKVASVTNLHTDTDGSISFDLSFDVSLKAHGLKRPSMMGMIRVGDRVQVTATARLIHP